jgi:hypothetical protein
MKTSGSLLSPFPVTTFLMALALAAAPTAAGAACNAPLNTPGPQPLYASATGSIDTPFLIPGKVPGPDKYREATVFGPASGATAPANGDIVTVAFMQGSTKAILVLDDDCSMIPSCPNATVECEKATLVFNAASGGLPASVRFAAGKGLEKLGRVGPVRLAVSPAANLPCDLVDPAKSCGDFSSLHTCIDKVTPADTRPVDATIDSITALPAPNEFKKLCKSTNAADDRCQGGEVARLEFALDAHGDIVMPIHWGKLLKKLDGTSGDCEEGKACDKRKIVANTNLPSGLAGLAAIQIGCADSAQFLQSFAADGTVFSAAPIFQVDPGNPDPAEELRLLGSIDKAFSVLRIRRCPQSNLTCGATQKFELSSRIQADGKPISLGRRGNRQGFCDESGTLCSNDSSCIGKACLYAEGEEHGPYTGPSILTCQLSTPPEDGSGVWVLILLVIGGVVILVWVFRRR